MFLNQDQCVELNNPFKLLKVLIVYEEKNDFDSKLNIYIYLINLNDSITSFFFNQELTLIILEFGFNIKAHTGYVLYNPGNQFQVII